MFVWLVSHPIGSAFWADLLCSLCKVLLAFHKLSLSTFESLLLIFLPRFASLFVKEIEGFQGFRLAIYLLRFMNLGIALVWLSLGAQGSWILCATLFQAEERSAMLNFLQIFLEILFFRLIRYDFLQGLY